MIINNYTKSLPKLSNKSITFVLILVQIFSVSSLVQADSFSDTFDLSCLKKEKLKCGKDDLSKIPPNKLTDKQRKVASCRIKALYSCMKKKHE